MSFNHYVFYVPFCGQTIDLICVAPGACYGDTVLDFVPEHLCNLCNLWINSFVVLQRLR
ncbi:MAG: hypothetical protein V7638_4227 [Acidobacteriota bacterium]|jgi:hypothetical protein